MFISILKLFLLVTLFLSVSESSTLDGADLPSIPNGGKLWVVLAAGSNSWYNYRHQADVCHAYQIVHSHGVPDEQIIVLMYDDIAENELNPTPGIIINRPNGTNVYDGVPKDYTKDLANNETFIKILLGEDIPFGSGKTLRSGPNDHVFVYFSDHGAKGLVAFGEAYLTAEDLNKAILKMHNENKFKKMVFYLEACESGSMFKNLLPENIDVFATTASDSITSSYACYYDDLRATFLGDVYSVKWLEDSDIENINKETLEYQYELVKRETNTSTVCKFGDPTMGDLKVSDFQGDRDTRGKPSQVDPSFYNCGADAVPSFEVPRVILERRLLNARNSSEKELIKGKLQALMQGRRFLSKTTKKIVHVVTGDSDLTLDVYANDYELTNFDCYYKIVDVYHRKCFNLGCNPFALRQVNIFANLCHMGYDSSNIIKTINKVCRHKQVCGVH